VVFLHVNVDHVATVRQARRTIEPDPVAAAVLVELAGAHGITIHLREDRRHILDRDVRLIRQIVQTRLNLEMAATVEMFGIALEVKPDIVMLVPERREEVSTEGGLDAAGASETMKDGIRKLKDAGIPVSLFIDPEPWQVEASQTLEVEVVELHTGSYANAKAPEDIEQEYARLHQTALQAHEAGLQVNAGHGLNYHNTRQICQLPHLRELHIGHSIISRSVFTGISEAVRDMLKLIHESTPQA